MSAFVFEDHFAARDAIGRPCNWRVQKHSSLGHIHGEVTDRGFELFIPGARYLPVLPPVGDFSMEVEWALATSYSNEVILGFVFSYEPCGQRGESVRLHWKDGNLHCARGMLSRRDFDLREEKMVDGVALRQDRPVRVVLEKLAGRILVRIDGAIEFSFELEEGGDGGVGAIGLERGFFPGFVVLRSVRIAAPVTEPSLLLWEHKVDFPPGLDGMNVPLRCGLALRRFGKVYELRVCLSGGALEKPDVADFEYQGRVVDRLLRPHLRLAGRDGEKIFLLHPGEQILGKVPGRFFYEGLYPKPEWPLERVFYLEADFDPLAPIALGYEAFRCSASRALSGGPTEILLDPADGSILHAGGALAAGRIDLALTSPADQRLQHSLPAEDPRHAEAVAFCANNHFFSQGAPCCFRAVVRCERADIDPGELSLVWSLEDVFRDPIGPGGCVGRTPTPAMENPCTEAGGEPSDAWRESPQPGRIRGFEAPIQLPDDLAPGVYHLQAALFLGGGVVSRLRKAFEVLPGDPKSPPPPLLSGLPVLFSASTETMGLDTDPFDPWRGVGNDAAHYISICCFFPEFARENKIWETVHLYGRKWFCWLTTRTTPHHRIDENRDILAHVDFVNLAADPDRYHLYIWKSNLYRGIVLEVFNRFLSETGRQPIAGAFREEDFRELVLPNWNAWVAYFCRWLCFERLPEQQRRIGEINPSIRRSDYGPVNGYCSAYKTAYSMRYRGLDPASGLEQLYNGFFLYEDYPFACGYAIHAKTFTLACLKLANPRLLYYPEIYAPSVQGSPDSAVMMGNPPFGIYGFPAHALRKRVFEFAFAVVWHAADGFHFWKDDGFHARNWGMELYGEFLDAWKFVRGHRAVRPLRGSGFVFSMDSCLAHAETYRPPAGGYSGSDVFNSAEECVPFAYDVARKAGIQAGFAASMESLAALDPQAVDLLVLPPLRGVPSAQIASIRKLHEAGVNLLAFESVDGLEDLFGVDPLRAPQPVREIRTAAMWEAPVHPEPEVCEHGLCQTGYAAGAAHVLLEGDGGELVLASHITRWGKTALWAVAPTFVRRENFYERGIHGRENISELVEVATRQVLQALGDPAVTTTAGKVLAFSDAHGCAHIVVSEDAHPAPSRPIQPLVEIRLPGIENAKIRCDRPFELVNRKNGAARIRLLLDPHQCAVISVDQ